MAIVPETRYATAGDVSIAYNVVGDGAFDLVFVPDWLTNLELQWEHPPLARFLRRLASFSRLIVFDKRGTGLSDPVSLTELPTLEQWMDDVRVVMEAAGSRQAALVGFGGAGPMCMLFAATHPQRTSALVLLETFARLRRAPDYPAGIPDHMADGMLAWVKEAWGSGDMIDLFGPSDAGDAHLRETLGRVQRQAASPRTASSMMRMLVDTDVRSVLPTISVPTLVVHRTEDSFSRIAHGRYLAESIAGAKLAEVSGRDYLFFVGDANPILDEVQEFLTGVREPSIPDRQLLTVLFTDIAGSTQRAAALGDRAWRDVLQSHHAIVRRQLERYRGREVDTAGDGFFATFDGPARAIRCALAITEAVRVLDLEVRAGVHTGECEVIAGKVGGIAVHVGARVASLAAPGDVLVSSTVRDLVAGSGIGFADRGTHVLKGLPDEWRLFAVDG
jgi:class 3 adenylate cyclase